MPTVDPYYASLAKFHEQEMVGVAKRAKRIEEAVCAFLVGANGRDDQGRIVIDTDDMARASKAGWSIKAAAEGARLVFSVIDAKGEPVTPDVVARVLGRPQAVSQAEAS